MLKRKLVLYHEAVLRNFIDDKYLPSHTEATRWVKLVPIIVNIFVWRARRDCFPTRTNLEHRGVDLLSSNCSICHDFDKDINHSLFRCDLAECVLRRVCRWWNFDPQELSTFLEWQTWFISLRLASKNKVLLEGVFYVAWWSIWRFRNHCVFEDRPPRPKDRHNDAPKCGKCRTKAMMDAAKSLGVNSVELQEENKNQMVVIEDGVDAAALTSSVRKKVKNASLEMVQQL
uniref:RNA-directed DNA polymerase, eukaryota n=1 Tax=Tanacetum cinerariifolium TaxID=118510 RepID=A0A699L144_TANCI|nr:RNA-directed DNA polymerase, eukaryota [Tanacetum cinerariifolium]